jgi:hypothetical protein
MTLRIDDFKGQLPGGGARPNLFRVEGTFPSPVSGLLAEIGGAAAGAQGRAIGGSVGNTLGGGGPSNLVRFLCKGASIPGMTVEPVEVPFRGRVLKVPGDRTFEPWELTIINDTDFSLRDAFEKWNHLINSMEGNTGSVSLQEIQQNWRVTQLGKNNEELKTYEIVGCWPSTVSPIELSYESTGAIEEFTVTLEYQYFKTNTTD